MKAKAKSFIILIVTFILGIVLGIVISNTFMRSDYRKKVDRLRTPEGFVGLYERIIQPEEAQRDTLQFILRNHFEKIKEQGENSFRTFHALEDSLYIALAPVLTDEQNQRLKDHREHIKKRRENKSRRE